MHAVIKQGISHLSPLGTTSDTNWKNVNTSWKNVNTSWKNINTSWKNNISL